MKLALEISLALGLAFVVVLVGAMAIGVEREVRLVERDLRRDHVALGTQLASAVGRVWKAAGPDEALALLEASPDADGLGARWRWLDETSTMEPPLTAKEAAQLRNGYPLSLSLDGRDGRMRLTLVPVLTPDGRLGAIEIRERLLQDVQEYLWARGVMTQAALTIGAAITISGALAVALGVFLVGRPVRMLVEKARRIGAGDLTGEIVLARRNELGELATEMNAMARKLAVTRGQADREATERIQALEQLRHADRLTTIGKLASGIGHELGTPLAIVTGRAELILLTTTPRSCWTRRERWRPSSASSWISPGDDTPSARGTTWDSSWGRLSDS
jgi:signal transduction histidine kinase